MRAATAHRRQAGRPRLVPLGRFLVAICAAGALAASAEPQPVPREELRAVRVAGSWGGSGGDDGSSGGGSSSPAPFSIDASATDLNTYVMDCLQLRGTFRDWRIEAYSSTVANRSAHYLAVDVKLYTKRVLRKQKFVDGYGPISAISTSVLYTAPCHEYEEASPLARGWHKGIDERGYLPIYKNSSDR